MKSSVVVSVIASLLIILWAYAAASKLLDYETSRNEMLNQVFPREISKILTWLVPTAELTTAFLLLFRKTRFAGLYISASLLFAFTAYIVLVLGNTFGRTPCSCGGVLEKLNWGQHLVFNFVFLLLALLGVYYEFQERRANER